MKPRTVGIRGAGLSGLSLARELLRMEPSLRVTIYDTRPRLPHPPRTFCFLNRGDHGASSIPSFSWNSVMFRGSSFQRRLDVSKCPYTMIRGDDFFSSTLHALESHGVEFSWECSEVELIGNAIRADDKTKNFDTVVDAAFDAQASTATLWQSFAGVWVTAHRSVFDPSTALLMDLDESSVEAPVSFLYVLPISERTALVEHTTFSPSPMPKGYHLDRCFSWLERNHGAAVQPGATEYGRIPMGLQTPKPATRLTVGSAAGIVRPATGYAFVRAQEQARQVANKILDHGPSSTNVYPRWLTLGDSLFLRALLNAPERGKQIMEGLLSRAPGDSLIAFLAGDVRPLDALSVWLSAPKRAMMRSLLRV